MAISYPQYVIGEHQPDGQQEYCLWGGYLGYIVGTGGTGDLHTATVSLEAHLTSSYGRSVHLEVLGYSGSLGSLNCGAPFSGSGYDGTFAAFQGCPQYVVIGIPLVEGSFTHGSTSSATAHWASGATTIFDTSITTFQQGWYVSGNGIPSGAYVGAVSTGTSFTLMKAGSPIATTAAAASPGGVLTFKSNLDNVTAGLQDAKFTAIGASLNARGRNRTNCTIRLGWEMAGGWPWGLNYIDPATGALQTPAQFIPAFRRAVSMIRAGGYTGRFALNAGGAGGPDWGTIFPGDAYCDVIEWDAYNSIHRADLYPASNPQAVIDNEMKPAFAAMFTFARNRDAGRLAQGVPPLLCGVSECGMIIQPSNAYHTIDTAAYWPFLHDTARDNADRMAYIIAFFQNQYDTSGNITENNTPFFSVTSGTLADQATGKDRHTSTHGPWVDERDSAHSLSNPTFPMMTDGTMQLVPQPPVPAETLSVQSDVRPRRGQVHVLM